MQEHAIRKRLRTTKARMRQVILFVAVLVGTAISLNAQTAPDAAQLTKLLNDFSPEPAVTIPPPTTVFGFGPDLYSLAGCERTRKS
jgi:hypothetical protein